MKKFFLLTLLLSCRAFVQADDDVAYDDQADIRRQELRRQQAIQDQRRYEIRKEQEAQAAKRQAIQKQEEQAAAKRQAIQDQAVKDEIRKQQEAAADKRVQNELDASKRSPSLPPSEGNQVP